MQSLETLGIWAKDLILSGAALLKDDYFPGIISIGFFLVLAILIAWFLLRQKRQRAAIRSAKAIIEETAGEADFFDAALRIDQKFQSLEQSRKGSENAVGTAWGEYRETTVQDDKDGADAVRNAIRPSLFFNLEDLGFTLGWWRVVPGLFVSIGLALTFLGLISALDQTAVSLQVAGGDGGAVTGALQDLLTIASAKFIMSLSGLACSILFTMVMRQQVPMLDKGIHGFCTAIEKRLSFVSLEDLAMQQLRAIQSQNEHMTKLNNELVAELARPLREELPSAIAKSISEAIGPAVDVIQQGSVKGVRDMASGISEQISQQVGDALQTASSRLVEAAERLDGLATKLDRSSSDMGDKLAAAAASFDTASQSIKDQLQASASEAGARVAQAGSEAEAKVAEIGQSLQGPLNAVRSALQEIGSSIEGSSENMKRFGESVELGAQATERAAKGLGEASGSLTAAVTPIRQTGERIEAAANRSADASTASAQAVTKSAEQVARTGASAMETALEILGHEREAIAQALKGIETAVDRFASVADHYDEIDVKLGEAFRVYQNEVARSVDEVREHAENVHGLFSEALDTLRGVVEQAETFAPQSRAR